MFQLAAGLLLDLSQSLERFFGLFGMDIETARAHAVRLIVIWTLAAACWVGVRMAAAHIVKLADDGDDTRLSYQEKRAQTISGLLKGAGTIVITAFTLILTLNVFMNIAPLLAGAGVIGLAVSFGSQSLVKDVIAGFFILSENQFDVGDVIEVAGLAGGVEQITLRVVRLRDIEGVLHVIPNGQITTVSNKTRGWSRAVVDVGVAYETDVDQALAVLRDEAAAFHADGSWTGRLDGAPEVVGVQGLDDSAVTLRTMLRTQPGLQWDVGREFRRRIKNRFDREGIEIPFPQRTVHMRQAPADPGASR